MGSETIDIMDVGNVNYICQEYISQSDRGQKIGQKNFYKICKYYKK